MNGYYRFIDTDKRPWWGSSTCMLRSAAGSTNATGAMTGGSASKIRVSISERPSEAAPTLNESRLGSDTVHGKGQ